MTSDKTETSLKQGGSEKSNDPYLKVLGTTIGGDLSKLFNMATGTYSSFLIHLELLPDGGGSDRVQKVRERQVTSENPTSNCLGPGEKLSSLYEFISSKEPSGYLKNMKVELKLERTLDQYFNFG